MNKFNELMKRSTDVFALDNSELGCTNVVSHKVDTGDHTQMPYRIPVIYRDITNGERDGGARNSSTFFYLSEGVGPD